MHHKIFVLLRLPFKNLIHFLFEGIICNLGGDLSNFMIALNKAKEDVCVWLDDATIM